MNRELLQNWQDWNLPGGRKPELIREIGIGRTNRSFLIKAGHDLYILRINAGNARALGIDRRREKSILEHVVAAGLAPEIMYCSIDKGVLVTEFIDGQHWQPADLDKSANLSLLLDSLNHIHALQVNTPEFDYQKHAENYWQLLLNRNITIPDNLYRQRQQILPMLAIIPPSTVLCHQDPNPENIIVHTDRLYFLDWEYAAPAWPAFDFAALSVEWKVPVDKLASQNNIDIEECRQAVDLYLYLCDLWLCLFGSENIAAPGR